MRCILSLKTSHFNSQKIIGNCEECNIEIAVDTHHLQHQQNANDNKYINSFYKDHTGNLMNLCKDCHRKKHENSDEHKRVKTSKGFKLAKIEK